MSVSELSASTQNYLKAVWGLSEWSSDLVTPSLIAERTGLSLSSVSDALRRMTGQGLVDHAPYGSVVLTDTGRAHALAMVRRHRLIEAFLVTALGCTERAGAGPVGPQRAQDLRRRRRQLRGAQGRHA
ncbi:metal-dependent transcriptional regulator [Tessaracoccus palaemonis]|uniref:Manganese transport regulator n=1 Tax=Tessaracoccus palaemonis TaxID=2829499 RepID=A0ABX8SH32_9ACTN|nr:metal-dependent transcriptional regulator [Tessaracoccus palaemonis]QXT62259.1 metal-dependent transcriptional regulator [Tessaracoccus palaemonis]